MDFVPSEEAAEQVNDNVYFLWVVSCYIKHTPGMAQKYVHWHPAVCPWKGLRIIGNNQTMSVHYVHDGCVSLSV